MRIKETIVIDCITSGELKTGNTERQRFIEVEPTFDILIDRPFEFNDLVADFKSEGMGTFYPVTLFALPLFFPYFLRNGHIIIPERIADFSSGMKCCKQKARLRSSAVVVKRWLLSFGGRGSLDRANYFIENECSYKKP